MDLSDFTTLTFDCYGTLIDWESGMVGALAPLISRVARPLTRNEILQAHAFHESSAQAQTPAKPYFDVLATVYKRLAEQWGVNATHEACVTYGLSVPSWPAFDDSVAALIYLKQHFKLVVLSNIDNASFAASNRRLQVTFDAVYSAQDIGSYKPADANFEYMIAQLGHLGTKPTEILHTAESLFHDHVPAKRFGLANCWIYRRHGEEGFGATRNPGAMPQIDFRFHSMAEFADAHRAELAQN